MEYWEEKTEFAKNGEGDGCFIGLCILELFPILLSIVGELDIRFFSFSSHRNCWESSETNQSAFFVHRKFILVLRSWNVLDNRESKCLEKRLATFLILNAGFRWSRQDAGHGIWTPDNEDFVRCTPRPADYYDKVSIPNYVCIQNRNQ